MELLQNLEQINEKLRLLAEKTTQLAQQNEQLKTENKKLTASLEDQGNDLQAVQHKLERLRNEQDDGEKTHTVLDQDIRQQIDHYLVEIDQCIEWLKKQ